jgi:hypothetical protein
MGINFAGSVSVEGQTIEVGQNKIAFDKQSGHEPMTVELTVTRAGHGEQRESVAVTLHFTLDEN